MNPHSAEPPARLDRLHVANTRVRYRPHDTIFTQGDRCAAVMYIQKGRVKLTATSHGGREAVVGVLHAGAFFGEGALAGQRRRMSTAQAMTASTITMVKTADMRRGLHDKVALSKWFRSYLLSRNTRIEEDLVDQMFNNCDKRLARLLLLLTNFDEHRLTRCLLPRISRNVLAETIGCTRSKIDDLMTRFRRLGFLERHSGVGALYVHCSMLNVILRD